MKKRAIEDVKGSVEADADRTLVDRVGAIENQLQALLARLGPAEPTQSDRAQNEHENRHRTDDQIDQALQRISEFSSALRDQGSTNWDTCESVVVRAVLRDLALVIGHLREVAGESYVRITAARKDLKAIRRVLDGGVDELKVRALTHDRGSFD